MTARDDVPEHAPFWAGTAAGRLLIQRCEDCGTWRFPPSPLCATCRSSATTWAEASGQGRVLSWARTHHAFSPAFAARVPYTVLLVELAEQPGLVMYGNLRREEPVHAGMPVRAVFQRDAAEHGDVLVYWTPVPD